MFYCHINYFNPFSILFSSTNLIFFFDPWENTILFNISLSSAWLVFETDPKILLALYHSLCLSIPPEKLLESHWNCTLICWIWQLFKVESLYSWIWYFFPFIQVLFYVPHQHFKVSYKIMFLKFIPKYFISYVFGYFKMTFSFLRECNWTLCIQKLFPEN